MQIELTEHEVELITDLLRDQQQRMEIKPQSRLAIALAATYRIPAERLEQALQAREHDRPKAAGNRSRQPPPRRRLVNIS